MLNYNSVGGCTPRNEPPGAGDTHFLSGWRVCLRRDFFLIQVGMTAILPPFPSLILLELICVVFVSFLLFLVERIEAIERVRIVQKLAITARNLRESLKYQSNPSY
jgi:hypothetical protein